MHQACLLFIFVLMCERKAWTKEEDDLLRQIMMSELENKGERKLKWNDIALKICQQGTKTVRKGKQCRERWFNQLHPNIVKEQSWLPEEEKTLFQFQEKFGNHWAKIAKHLPGRSDNSIKNYFYSCLRKALRKVNNYVYINKRLPQYKNIKAFHNNNLSKILSVAENKAENKISISKEEGPLIARSIKKLLIQIQVFQKDQESEDISDIMSTVVSKIQEFNRICKRKKTKRKVIPKKEIAGYQPQDSLENLSYDQEQESISIEKVQMGQSQQSLVQIVASESSEKLVEERSQPVKQEIMAASHKYSTSTSIEEYKKMQNEVLIPSCKYNCQPNKNIYLPQPLNFQRNFKSSEKAKQKSVELVENQRRPFLPYLPLFHPGYFHGPAMMPPSFYRKQVESLFMGQGRLSFPFANSSFNLCPEWLSLERLNPFSREPSSQIKEEVSRQQVNKE